MDAALVKPIALGRLHDADRAVVAVADDELVVAVVVERAGLHGELAADDRLPCVVEPEAEQNCAITQGHIELVAPVAVAVAESAADGAPGR